MNLLALLLTLCVLAVEAALAVAFLYLLCLSVGALLAASRQRRMSRRDDCDTTASASEPLTRFILLVPAHDEAATISPLLESIAALDYPADARTTCVVADNCTDTTAAVARAAGARVYERYDNAQRSKGHALRWLLGQLQADEPIACDAYVIVDADSVLAPNFLRVLHETLRAGAQVIQAEYRVSNGAESWTSGLRAVAFALFNHVRPLGRACFGWSAGLKGNGMCFRKDVLEALGWGAFSLAEDAEHHVSLLRKGIRVTYTARTSVSSAMPVSLRQAQSQNARWEQGRIVLARRYVPTLLQLAFARHSLLYLDAALELLVPPLSLLVGLLGVVVVLAAVVHGVLVMLVALALVGAFAGHLLTGMYLARLPRRAYLSLAVAPLFITWKIWVYLVALVARNRSWVRTERVPVAVAEPGEAPRANL